MGHYRLKPLIFEAVQWTGNIYTLERPDWIRSAIEDGRLSLVNNKHAAIKSLSGYMLYAVDVNDWIVKDINGALHQCNNTLFHTMYQSNKISHRKQAKCRR